MHFLTIVLTWCLARYTIVAGLLQRDGWLLAVTGRGLLRDKPALLRTLLLVGIPLLAFMLLWQLGFWMSFLLGVLLLLYSIGRGDWRALLADEETRMQTGNAESLWLALEAQGVLPANGDSSAPAADLWFAWRRHAARLYLDGLFAVIFWFFLLGPAGALMYRMASLYARLSAVRAGQLPPGADWLAWLDWLPARYMALCACLAGNFTPGFLVWRTLLPDTRLAADELLARQLEASLLQHGPAAAVPDEALRLVCEHAPALRELLTRTEIIGLVGLAVAILVIH